MPPPALCLGHRHAAEAAVTTELERLTTLIDPDAATIARRDVRAQSQVEWLIAGTADCDVLRVERRATAIAGLDSRWRHCLLDLARERLRTAVGRPCNRRSCRYHSSPAANGHACLDALEPPTYPLATTVDNLERLQNALAYRFRDPDLLRQALVHRSYLNETAAPDIASNERLEFLGDAVLGLVVADELFRRFPDLPEGDLTEMRAHLVRGSALAPVAARIDLGSCLVLGHGEEQTGGRRRRVNLGRAFEAVLGAVYLDSGLEQARTLVLRLAAPEFEALRNGVVLDAKSRLQQLAQSDYRVTPEYVTVSADGPPHARRFTVEVRFGDRVVGSGSGESKRQAQQEAARAALEATARKFAGGPS